MNDFDRPIAEDESLPRRPRLSLRTVMGATSFLSIVLGLPFVQRLLAAGLGAILAAIAALVGLQLLVFLAFKGLGLLPGSDVSRAS